MAKYEELIDDFALEKRIKTIPEDMDLTEYIKQRGGVDYPEEKADGGSIGIEVLFEEKMKDGGRVGLFMGGPALEGQALAIYNSMNVTGATDQEIAERLSSLGLYTPGGTTTTPDTNIIGAQLNQDRGGGRGIMELQETFTRPAGSDPSMSKDALFGLGRFFQGKERGTLGTRIANQPRLPLPGSIAAYTRSPFNPDSPTYNPLLEGQLNFLEGLEDMIGRDPGTGGLKYGSGSVLAGKNVISGFGSNNYEVALNKFIRNTKNEERRKQAQAELAAEKERQIREAKTKAEALAAIQSQGKMDYNPSIHGPTDYGKDDKGNQSFDSGMGFGIGSDGGPVSNKTGKGRTGYSEGGLATMFTRRR